MQRLTLFLLFLVSTFSFGAEPRVQTSSPEIASACEKSLDFISSRYGRSRDWEPFPVYFHTYRNDGVAGYTSYSPPVVREVVVYFPLDQTVGGTLDHELTHAYNWYRYGRKSIPLFWNEGSAQNMEYRRRNELRQATYRQYVAGEFWSLRELVSRNSYDDRLRMYRESYSVCEMLIRQGGARWFAEFLKEVVETGDVDRALRRWYGYKNVEALEKDWVAYLNRGQKL